MRMGNALMLAVMALFGGGVACGGDGGGSVPIGAYPAETAQVFCAKTFECCTSAEIMEQFSFFSPPITTEAQCVTTFTAFAQLGVGQLQASIDSGRLVYDADAAGDCLATASDLSCADYAALSGDNPCTAVFEGQVAADGACARDEECVSGYCEGDSTSPPTEGVCKAKPGVGAPCPDFDCADGAYCDFGAMGGPACTATKADGATCDSDDECTGGACVGSDPMMGTPGTCGAETTCDGV